MDLGEKSGPLDDATKDMENLHIVDDLVSNFVSNSDSRDVNHDSVAFSDLESCSDRSKKTVDDDDKCNIEGNSDDVESKSDKVDDDFIDIEFLKKVEAGYAEEDFEKYRLEAAEIKACGNQEFKRGLFKESADSYTHALRTCPLKFSEDRAILFANRAACKMKLQFKESAIEDCSNAIELNPSYLKARIRRAHLYEETDKLDEALSDYQHILSVDPRNVEAIMACRTLPERITERNEKLKTEMLGKLKELGNMILKPFNLSTDNFACVQDPQTGGYSVNFKR